MDGKKEKKTKTMSKPKATPTPAAAEAFISQHKVLREKYSLVRHLELLEYACYASQRSS